MHNTRLITSFCIPAALSLFLCGGCAENAVPQSAPPDEESSFGETESITAAVMRPSMVKAAELSYETAVKPSVPDYTVADDFSDVINFGSVYIDDEIKEDLKNNLFAVGPGYGYEFFELYEDNSYHYGANFVTVDSLLHTYHLYYAFLQKNAERQFLLSRLKSMSEKLLAESQMQYDVLKETPFESAAQRNVDFFTVGTILSGGQAEPSDAASQELKLISAAEGLAVSPVFSSEEPYQQDYSQFIPRGYYTEGADLESYFRTMMWYGQMNFTQSDEDLDRSALLASVALNNAAKDDWEAIYQATAFLAGESDDNGYYEYFPLIQTVYGEDPSAEKIASDETAFQKFHELTGKLDPPQLNSMIIYEWDDREEKTGGFRLMGQRFSIDASILQKLVYRDVEKNAQGKKRMLPDALDVPAGLGSEEALKILHETTDVSSYPNYDSNMNDVRTAVSSAPAETWSSSVSAAWLNTLRPLLKEDRTGYPSFMQSAAWQRKNLTSFLGSYTELKHDTVLYHKQILAELGADGASPFDDRGYVEPEPEVFGRLAKLSEATVSGLDSFGMISDEDKEYMGILTDLASKLSIIAEKELNNELPTDEEFDLIRYYGGQLEHLWLRTVKTEGHDDYYTTQEFPAALVTDIATDPEGGTCLELGTGDPAMIYVIVSFDGALHITSGSVYTFYQFEEPLSKRLTDEEWREIIGSRNSPSLPEWMESYSHKLFLSNQKALGAGNVLVSNLNVRTLPGLNGDVADTLTEGDYITVYEITKADGYTWYRIGTDRWVADQGGWIDYYEFNY